MPEGGMPEGGVPAGGVPEGGVPAGGNAGCTLHLGHGCSIFRPQTHPRSPNAHRLVQETAGPSARLRSFGAGRQVGVEPLIGDRDLAHLGDDGGCRGADHPVRVDIDKRGDTVGADHDRRGVRQGPASGSEGRPQVVALGLGAPSLFLVGSEADTKRVDQMCPGIRGDQESRR